MSQKTILVTGANRGIGLEVVRQLSKLGHRVVFTARDAQKGAEALAGLQAEKLNVSFVPLDIAGDESIRAAVSEVTTQFRQVDVLINNAAILRKQDRSLLTTDWQVIEETIDVDALAPLKVCRSFAPLVADGGRIIMTSSGGGSMTDPVGGWSPAYCVAKSLLNAITRHLAHELAGRGIAANAYCPGWVKTDMGGESAPRTVEQGADTAVWLATANVNETGKFFRDRRVIPW